MVNFETDLGLLLESNVAVYRLATKMVCVILIMNILWILVLSFQSNLHIICVKCIQTCKFKSSMFARFSDFKQNKRKVTLLLIGSGLPLLRDALFQTRSINKWETMKIWSHFSK